MLVKTHSSSYYAKSLQPLAVSLAFVNGDLKLPRLSSPVSLRRRYFDNGKPNLVRLREYQGIHRQLSGSCRI